MDQVVLGLDIVVGLGLLVVVVEVPLPKVPLATEGDNDITCSLSSVKSLQMVQVPGPQWGKPGRSR